LIHDLGKIVVDVLLERVDRSRETSQKRTMTAINTSRPTLFVDELRVWVAKKGRQYAATGGKNNREKTPQTKNARR
jgi:hypothetical protein